MSYRRILAALVVWSAHYIPDAFTVFQVPYTYVAFVPLYAVSLWGTIILTFIHQKAGSNNKKSKKTHEKSQTKTQKHGTKSTQSATN